MMYYMHSVRLLIVFGLTALRMVAIAQEAAEPLPFEHFFKTTDTETPWEFQEKREGVNMFTRPVKDEPLREYKFLSLMTVPFDTVKHVMASLETYDKWLSSTVKDWKVVKRDNDSSMIVYFRADMPAPIKDQDVVLRVNIYRQNDKMFQVAFSSVDDVLPHTSHCNRVLRCNLTWNFRSLPNGFVGLTYMGSITPSGYFPPDFSTKILLKVPFENVDGLRKRLESANLNAINHKG